MKKILLLGLGNDLLCDDAIGLRVAAAARKRLKGREEVTVIESTEMGLALLDLIVGFDALLLVDAVQTVQSRAGVSPAAEAPDHSYDEAAGRLPNPEGRARRLPYVEAGFMHEIDAEDLKALPTISPHFLGVSEVLALGKELGLRVPEKVKIFAIEVEDPFTLSTRMTPALEKALPGIVERVLGEIDRFAAMA